jgi:hypothetical protein
MENSSQDTGHVLLDDDLSYYMFYIDGEEIKFSSNFKTNEDMIEILNLVVNTNAGLNVILEGLTEEDAEELKTILSKIKNKKKPVVPPLSMSRQR